jgi:hypothetical protein
MPVLICAALKPPARQILAQNATVQHHFVLRGAMQIHLQTKCGAVPKKPRIPFHAIRLDWQTPQPNTG